MWMSTHLQREDAKRKGCTAEQSGKWGELKCVRVKKFRSDLVITQNSSKIKTCCWKKQFNKQGIIITYGSTYRHIMLATVAVGTGLSRGGQNLRKAVKTLMTDEWCFIKLVKTQFKKHFFKGWLPVSSGERFWSFLLFEHLLSHCSLHRAYISVSPGNWLQLQLLPQEIQHRRR